MKAPRPDAWLRRLTWAPEAEPPAALAADAPAARRPSIGLVLPLLVLALAATGLFGYSAMREEVADSTRARLESVARLKVRQIGNWLEEQRQDVEGGVAETPQFVEDLERWLAGERRDARLHDRLATYLRQAFMHPHYRTMSLRSARDGSLLLSTGGHPDLPELRTRALEAVRRGGPVFEGLHFNQSTLNGDIDVGLFSPIRYPGTTRAVAVVHLTANPDEFLFPLLATWLDPSRTAETLLVRRDGDEVQFLNEPRHRPGTALTLRLPLGRARLTEAKAALGQTGPADGEDYRGESVLAYAMPVPGSDWVIVTKIDAAEAYAGLNEAAATLAVAMTLLLLAIGGSIAARNRIVAAGHRAEMERARVSIRFSALTRDASEGVLLADRAGRILDANECALAMFGYAREEMVRLSIADLRAPHLVDGLPAALERILRDQRATYESECVRRDGSCFPVEISASRLQIGGQDFLQALVRDNTERKRHELALRKSEERLNAFFAASPMAMLILDQDLRFVKVNGLLASVNGLPPNAHVGRKAADVMPPDLAAKLEPVYRRVLEDGEVVRDFEFSREMPPGSGQVRHWAGNYFPLPQPGATQPGVGVIIGETTDRVRAEEALRRHAAERTRYAAHVEALSARLMAVQESERRALARELHDRTSADLATIKLNLKAASDAVHAGDATEAEVRLEDAKAMLDVTASTIREISAELRPALLDHAGLASAVEAYASQFSRRTGIGTSVYCPANLDLPLELQSALFRIIQEALGNCLRHARASAVEIVIARRDGRTSLRIADNGIGFDPDAVASRGGLGLITMRERAEFAGGTFAVHSAPGTGTRISVEV